MQETRTNLVEKAFEQNTDEQIDAFRSSIKKLRMGSTMIASNIRTMSRLELLVKFLRPALVSAPPPAVHRQDDPARGRIVFPLDCG